ncbi:MAG: hypothetical protein RLZZ416_259 [Candidatus Parcubacteria bacterium]|jgi:aspartyl-tRNA(Asn)/glutamyl-tRNA(Gln) amidotransferase subunit C
MTDPNVDVEALARLARLEVSAEELMRLEKEIPAILKFVEQIGEVHAAAPAHESALSNVMRDDANPIEPGTFTETLLSAAPSREGDRIAVKQVISRKK